MRKTWVMVAAMLLAIAAWAPVSADSSNADLDQVARLLDQGKLKSALRRIDSHIDKAPGDARGYFLKARVLEQAGRREQAAEVYRRMVEAFPDMPEPYVNLAVLAAQSKDYTAARELLHSALKVSPSCEAAYHNLSQLHATLATKAYQAALSVKARIPPPALTSVDELTGSNVAAASLNGHSVATAPSRLPASKVEDPPAAAVAQRVRSWAEAWSRRDVDAYLEHYAHAFQPGEIDRATWAAQRRVRLRSKRFIKVEPRDLQVVADGDRAVATFLQAYESDTFKDVVYKSLTMIRTADGWQITREISE